MRQVDWRQRLIRYWCLMQPSTVVMIRQASPRTCGIQQQVIVSKPVFDSLRAYFKCRQIGVNSCGSYCWEELSIIGILMMIHTMTADDLANRRHIRDKDQGPKNRALWYTRSAAYCCRAVASKFYKLLPVFNVRFQPFQRYVNDTEFISEPQQIFSMIRCIKHSRYVKNFELWSFFHRSPCRSCSEFSEVLFKLSGQSGMHTAADWSSQWRVGAASNRPAPILQWFWTRCGGWRLVDSWRTHVDEDQVFFKRGSTLAVFYVDENSPVLNEMFARLAITGEKTSAHDFSRDIGNTSRGVDLLGSRSFHSAAPTVWNSLPQHICQCDVSRGQFASHIKTWLFSCACA